MLKPPWFIIFVFCLLLPVTTIAIDGLELSIGKWSLEELQAENIDINLTLTEKGLGFIARADSIQLAPPIGQVSQLALNCNELQMLAGQFSCARGQISFQQKELGLQKLDFEIELRPSDDKYKVEIENLNLASALFSVTFIVKDDRWKVFADTPQVSLPSLIDFLSPYMQVEQLEVLDNWSVEGELKLDIDLKGQANQLNEIELDLVSNAVNLSDSQGLYVSEGLTSTLSLEARQNKQEWQWQTSLSINDGQGYAEPVFIDFSVTPMTLQADGAWLKEDTVLHVNDLVLEQKDITQVQGDLTVNLDGLTSLNLDVEKSQMAAVYSVWVQPFVVGTALDNLELTGDMTVQFRQNGDNYQLAIGLDKAFIHEQTGLFSIDELTGLLAWTNYDAPMESELHWERASVYALSLGASTVKAQVKSSSFVLLEPWILPILDGELKLKEFSLQQPDNEQVQWNFGGELTPISMESLSTTLGWPLLHGKLSGLIPRVSYADHKIKVDGALKVNLFEGDTIIRGLELDNPFGALPQLKANITLKGLNLETLTQTFDFGKITGKLDGKLNNLRLSNWQPVQFDASFATPEGDKSRRRISQKAVDNLSQIGGGASGILQRSFLRFFEDFSYQRLGLNCELRNEVCEMSGVDEAEQGYYIVKGGGLPPRINVVGYTRRVNWPDLIERLKAVSQSSGPVVK